jgi:hypothetical protein
MGEDSHDSGDEINDKPPPLGYGSLSGNLNTWSGFKGVNPCQLYYACGQ